jgi:hypothetical protein
MNISIYEKFWLWLTIKINKDDWNYHNEDREIPQFRVMVFWCYSNEESNSLLSSYNNLVREKPKFCLKWYIKIYALYIWITMIYSDYTPFVNQRTVRYKKFLWTTLYSLCGVFSSSGIGPILLVSCPISKRGKGNNYLLLHEDYQALVHLTAYPQNIFLEDIYNDTWQTPF